MNMRKRKPPSRPSERGLRLVALGEGLGVEQGGSDPLPLVGWGSMRDYEEYLLALGREPGTIQQRLYQIQRLSERHPLYGVTHTDLQAELARIRHLAPNTRRGILASWRTFYHWAYVTGRMEQDPTEGLPSVPIRARVPRVAPDDAIVKALERATPRDAALVGLARFACLRLSEVTTLHTRDRSGDMLIVRGKGDKERVVYINSDLEAILNRREAELADPRGYYFPGLNSDHMHPMSVNKIITRVTGHNPHSLRHAGATAAYRATHDLRAVQDMLGHASLETTQRYLHLADDARRRAAEGTQIPRDQRRGIWRAA